MIKLKHLFFNVLLPLLLLPFLSCADNPTEPELTEEDVARIVAEELAKMEEAKEDSLTPQEIAEIALKSTVVLDIKKENGKSTEGSGFVVGKGQVVTAHHVLKNMQVGSAVRRVGDETTHLIESIIATDKAHDIAIIKVPGFIASSLSLGDSDAIQVGQHIFVIGHPAGYMGTFSDGLISAIRPEDEPSAIIQITAPISLGSSGGAVLNDKGEVIAIATSGDLGGQNLNFAAPVNALKSLLKTVQ